MGDQHSRFPIPPPSRPVSFAESEDGAPLLQPGQGNPSRHAAWEDTYGENTGRPRMPTPLSRESSFSDVPPGPRRTASTHTPPPDFSEYQYVTNPRDPTAGVSDGPPSKTQATFTFDLPPDGMPHTATVDITAILKKRGMPPLADGDAIPPALHDHLIKEVNTAMKAAFALEHLLRTENPGPAAHEEYGDWKQGDQLDLNKGIHLQRSANGAMKLFGAVRNDFFNDTATIEAKFNKKGDITFKIGARTDGEQLYGELPGDFDVSVQPHRAAHPSTLPFQNGGPNPTYWSSREHGEDPYQVVDQEEMRLRRTSTASSIHDEPLSPVDTRQIAALHRENNAIRLELRKQNEIISQLHALIQNSTADLDEVLQHLDQTGRTIYSLEQRVTRLEGNIALLHAQFNDGDQGLTTTVDALREELGRSKANVLALIDEAARLQQAAARPLSALTVDDEEEEDADPFSAHFSPASSPVFPLTRRISEDEDALHSPPLTVIVAPPSWTEQQQGFIPHANESAVIGFFNSPRGAPPERHFQEVKESEIKRLAQLAHTSMSKSSKLANKWTERAGDPPRDSGISELRAIRPSRGSADYLIKFKYQNEIYYASMVKNEGVVGNQRNIKVFKAVQ